jgi:hypothetical protein
MRVIDRAGKTIVADVLAVGEAFGATHIAANPKTGEVSVFTTDGSPQAKGSLLHIVGDWDGEKFTVGRRQRPSLSLKSSARGVGGMGKDSLFVVNKNLSLDAVGERGDIAVMRGLLTQPLFLWREREREHATGINYRVGPNGQNVVIVGGFQSHVHLGQLKLAGGSCSLFAAVISASSGYPSP